MEGLITDRSNAIHGRGDDALACEAALQVTCHVFCYQLVGLSKLSPAVAHPSPGLADQDKGTTATYASPHACEKYEAQGTHLDIPYEPALFDRVG